MPLFRSDSNHLLDSFFATAKKHSGDTSLFTENLLNFSTLYGGDSGISDISVGGVAKNVNNNNNKNKNNNNGFFFEPPSVPINIPVNLPNLNREFSRTLESLPECADMGLSHDIATGKEELGEQTPLMTPPGLEFSHWMSSQLVANTSREVASDVGADNGADVGAGSNVGSNGIGFGDTADSVGDDDLWSVPLLIDDNDNVVDSFNRLETQFLNSEPTTSVPVSVPASLPVSVSEPSSSVSASVFVSDSALVSSCPTSISAGDAIQELTNASSDAKTFLTNDFVQGFKESLDQSGLSLSGPGVSAKPSGLACNDSVCASVSEGLPNHLKNISTTLAEIGGPEQLYSLLYNDLGDNASSDLRRIADKYLKPASMTGSSIGSSSTTTNTTTTTTTTAVKQVVFKRSYFDINGSGSVRASVAPSDINREADAEESMSPSDTTLKRVKLENSGSESTSQHQFQTSQTGSKASISKEEKRQLKRIRNTEAARRSRARKMNKLIELQQACDLLTQRNERLELQVFDLMVRLAAAKGQGSK